MTPTTGTPTVPTFTLIDSAGIVAFRDQLGNYYAPVPQAAQPFDPSGSTPDVILVENFGDAVRDSNRDNTNAWQKYKSQLFNSITVSGPAGSVGLPNLPHPPVYHAVNWERFKRLWNGWNDYNAAHYGDGTTLGFEEYKAQNPALAAYLDPVAPPAPPLIKVGPDANAPPPPPFTTDLVGAPFMQGIWTATPFAVASAMQLFDPNSLVISDTRSQTGYFRFYRSAFAGMAGFWIPCSKSA